MSKYLKDMWEQDMSRESQAKEIAAKDLETGLYQVCSRSKEASRTGSWG